LAQISTGSVNGTVRDASEAVVPGASVLLRDINRGVEQSSQTNAEGVYVFLEILPGNYDLRVTKEGFSSAGETGIPVVVGSATTHDFTLKVGEARQAVTVQATATPLDTASSGLVNALGENEVENLPLNGRNFTALLLLEPGASPINLGSTAAGYGSQAIGVFSFPSFHGQSNKSTLFLIDGVMATGDFQGGYSFVPNPDEISELDVQSHSDQAEFGQALGGVVDVVTKSGTNAFHGAAWEYDRNSAFAARNFFIKNVTPLHQNQFGANIGGPVVLPHYNGRNKTFFYGSFEDFRLSTANQVLYTVPTTANYAGDFSNSPQQIYNPYSTAPNPSSPGTYTRQPFPGNIVPAQYMDPKAVLLAQTVYPAPISTGFANLNGEDTSPSTQDQYQYTFRVDQNFGKNNSIWFRYTGMDQHKATNAGTAGDVLLIEPYGHNYGINYQHTFSPSWMIHGLFARNLQYVNVDYNIPRLNASTFLPTVFSPSFVCGFGANGGYGPLGCDTPTLNGTGFGEIVQAKQHLASGDNWQTTFDLSHVMGRHFLRWGGTWMTDNANNVTASPDVNFSSAQTADPNNAATTGNPQASFLMGLPTLAIRAQSVYRVPSDWRDGFWVEDTWKVTDKLTVNLGLRYDINFQSYVATSSGSPAAIGDMDFTTGNYILQKNPGSCATSNAAPCIPGGQLPAHVAVSTNKNGTIWDNDYKDFGPRLGIAYALNNKTAIRASYARLFDPWTNMMNDEANIVGGWPSISSISAGNLNALNVDTHMENPLPASQLPAATPFAQLEWYTDPHEKTPYSDQWNFGVERLLNPTTKIDAMYVGSHDSRLPMGMLYNLALTPGPGNPVLREPFPYTGPGFFSAGWGRASYNGFEFSLSKTSHELTYLVSYTWSKMMDVGTDPGGFMESYSIQNPYDFNADKSVGGTNLAQMLSAEAVWMLPWGSKNRPLNAAQSAAGI
jgi:outer membrane receptor protein involved in Fe transport